MATTTVASTAVAGATNKQMRKLNNKQNARPLAPLGMYLLDLEQYSVAFAAVNDESHLVLFPTPCYLIGARVVAGSAEATTDFSFGIATAGDVLSNGTVLGAGEDGDTVTTYVGGLDVSGKMFTIRNDYAGAVGAETFDVALVVSGDKGTVL